MRYVLKAGADRSASDDLKALKRAGVAALKRGVRQVEITAGGKTLRPLRRGAVVRWL